MFGKQLLQFVFISTRLLTFASIREATVNVDNKLLSVLLANYEIDGTISTTEQFFADDENTSL